MQLAVVSGTLDPKCQQHLPPSAGKYRIRQLGYAASVLRSLERKSTRFKWGHSNNFRVGYTLNNSCEVSAMVYVSFLLLPSLGKTTSF